MVRGTKFNQLNLQISFFVKLHHFLVFEGQQVVNDYTHKIVIKEDGTQSLIIVPAVPPDSGEWTVVAQNRAGRTSVSVDLSVEGMPHTHLFLHSKASTELIQLFSLF